MYQSEQAGQVTYFREADMPTVLIADDNQNIREFCRSELEEEGYRVLTARDGDEAVDLANQSVPDVIVLDICMPRVTGLEALTLIRRQHPNLGVILFTAYEDACLYDERAMTATACVAKNPDLSELKQVISSVLKSSRENTAYRIGLAPQSLAVR